MSEDLTKQQKRDALRLMRDQAQTGDTKGAAATFDAYCRLHGVTADVHTRDAFDAWQEAGNVLRRRLSTFASLSLHHLRNTPDAKPY